MTIYRHKFILSHSYSILMFLKGNAFWRLVRNLLKTPNKEQVDCQHPKPILLDTGEMKEPYDWAVSCTTFETYVNDVWIELVV